MMMRGGVRLVVVGDEDAWWRTVGCCGCLFVAADRPSVWLADVSVRSRLIWFIFRNFTTLCGCFFVWYVSAGFYSCAVGCGSSIRLVFRLEI